MKALLYIWPDGKMVLEAREDTNPRLIQEMRDVLEVLRADFLEGKPLFVSKDIEVRPVTYREEAA
jgi:hypothetical protein